MNRAERRAIKFGRAFSPMRVIYQCYDYVGIGADIDAAWLEYCRFNASTERDELWLYHHP